MPDEFTVKDSGKITEYADGMRRDTTEGKPKFSLLWPEGIPYEEQLMYRVAMHYTRGGEKYGDRNYEKSCTEESLAHHIDATERHLHKFLRGVEDGEDHAAAVVWGINAVLLTRWNIREKQKLDIPDEIPKAPKMPCINCGKFTCQLGEPVCKSCKQYQGMTGYERRQLD